MESKPIRQTIIVQQMPKIAGKDVCNFQQPPNSSHHSHTQHEQQTN